MFSQNDPTTVSVKFTTSAVKLLTRLISSKIRSDMAKHLTRQSFPIKTDLFSVLLILCWTMGYRIYILYILIQLFNIQNNAGV